MLFWYVLAFLLLVLFIIGYFADEKYNKWLAMLSIFIITFVSAFRFMIGVDYSEYADLYTYVGTDTSVYPEYSFRFLSEVLRNLNFNYQMLFVVYALISSWFIWETLKYFFDSYREILFAIFIFVITPSIGYWESMNTVRQFAASTIILYASRYVIERNWYKFLIFWGIASSLHYSALMMGVLYFIPVHYTTKRYVFMLPILGMLLYIIHIDGIVYGFLDILQRGASYALAANNKSIGPGILLCFVYIWLAKTSDIKQNFLCMMIGYDLLLYIAFANMTIRDRLVYYFAAFRFIMLAKIMLSFRGNTIVKLFTYLVVCSILLLFWGNVIESRADGFKHTTEHRESATNLNYEFNFQLYK